MILPKWMWVVLIVAALAATLYAGKVFGKPIYEADNGEVKVTLFDDPCELTDQIKNLRYKATWTEKGQVFRGCWSPIPQLKMIHVYFEDKTVGLIPVNALQQVHGT